MKLEGCVFHDENELFVKVKNILESIPKQLFFEAFTEWIKRLKEVIKRGGDYL